MAKYDKDTKFYWLQLKEDFFEDDAIQWLEEQKPNGRDYAYFYLKLCLKALKTEGFLIRKVGNILIPYDNKKLAELTKMDFDTVTVAMELLQRIGLVQILENGEIYIKQLESLIGSKSVGAFKKQQQRRLGGQQVDICPPKIEIELEKEKEIEIDIDKNININNNIIPEKTKTNFDEIVNLYNEYCYNLPKISKLTDKRKTAIRKFLKEFTIEDFKKICCLANENDFLTGDNDRNWKADFDFLLRTDKATAILENKYSNKRDKMDDFVKLWEGAKEKDEQQGNSSDNNFTGW